MSIVKTITDDYYFWNWLLDAKKRDSGYGNSFSIEGAYAVQEYFERASEDIGENIEFDPIAWCVEFHEYDSLAQAFQEYESSTESIKDMLQYFEERTTVIELNNGHIILGEF